jgi:hypothetical protein
MRSGSFFQGLGLAIALAMIPVAAIGAEEQGVFKAGAATANISPWVGLSMNGGMSDNPVKHVHDELHARAIVLDDGKTRLAFVIVDSCMIPREVVEAAKTRITEQTKIPADHVLISATHAHSAPASTPVFQTDQDSRYVKFLAAKIGDAVTFAVNNLATAQVGWGMGRNADQIFNRRWRKKPGTIPADPFGKTTDQVQMNPPPGSADLVEPAGPVDPEVGVLAVRRPDGTPIAVLSAYGLHYVGGVGGGHASADYYGAFARKMRRLLAPEAVDPPFVAAMANGTSGDVNNINFRTPRPAAAPYEQLNRVADELAAEVARVVRSIEYHDNADLDARTAEISLGVRHPGSEEIAPAEKILDEAKGKPLQTLEQIYARETVLIAEYPPEVPLTIQALRVGELGIAAIPCEVFTEIGLEIKAKSPLKPTFTIELANGYNGYLPTKAQHALGGYETWRARSSYLEVDAASKITATVLNLLGELKPRAASDGKAE